MAHLEGGAAASLGSCTPLQRYGHGGDGGLRVLRPAWQRAQTLSVMHMGAQTQSTPPFPLPSLDSPCPTP